MEAELMNAAKELFLAGLFAIIVSQIVIAAIYIYRNRKG